MNRREALASVSVLLGGAIIGAEVFLSGCKNKAASTRLFSTDDIALLDDIAETIIPTTADSGGGKAAGVGAFMKTMVTDCYTPIEQEHFIKGIAAFKNACQEKHQQAFTGLSAPQKEAFLTTLHEEAKAYKETEAYKKEKELFNKQQEDWVKAEEAKHHFGARYIQQSYPPHYFSMMRQLTLWGYFSSKEGMTKALRYVETPGRYDGAFPYKKGDKAWAL